MSCERRRTDFDRQQHLDVPLDVFADSEVDGADISKSRAPVEGDGAGVLLEDGQPQAGGPALPAWSPAFTARSTTPRGSTISARCRSLPKLPAI